MIIIWPKVVEHPDRPDPAGDAILAIPPLMRNRSVARIASETTKSAAPTITSGRGKVSRGCEHGDDCHGIGDDPARRSSSPMAGSQPSRTAPPSRQIAARTISAPRHGSAKRMPTPAPRRSSPPQKEHHVDDVAKQRRQPARRGSTVRHPGPATHRRRRKMISAAREGDGTARDECQEGQQGCRCRLQKRAPPGGVGAPQHEIRGRPRRSR